MDLIQRINRDGHTLLIASGIPTIQLACDDLFEWIKGRPGMTLGIEHRMGLSLIAWLEMTEEYSVFSALSVNCYERTVHLTSFGRDEPQVLRHVTDLFDEWGLEPISNGSLPPEVLESDHDTMLQLYRMVIAVLN